MFLPSLVSQSHQAINRLMLCGATLVLDDLCKSFRHRGRQLSEKLGVQGVPNIQDLSLELLLVSASLSRNGVAKDGPEILGRVQVRRTGGPIQQSDAFFLEVVLEQV